MTEIGELHLRRSILIAARPERVWREFESFKRIVDWFNHGHQIHALEPVVGGPVDMSIDGDGGPDERLHFKGNVRTVLPAGELTFDTNFVDEPMPAVTFWTFRLSGFPSGTLVEFFHHGYEAFGADAARFLEGFESAWDLKHLSALRRNVEGH